MSTTVAQNVKSMLAKNLNLLSLDAGGPQGISQLMILKNVMELISCRSGNESEGVLKRPCEVFHAIGGVGTGGLIAMFLVVLKMTATEALEEFTSLVNEVFKDVPMDPIKRTETLKQVIEGILENHGLEKGVQLIRAGEPQPTCKLIAPIMYKNNVGVPYVLRNYVASHEPPADITIAEAMLATYATPPMFTPTSVYKDFSDFEYIGGDLGLSNPTGEIIAEAQRAFGDEATVACLLSVGCGHSGTKSSPSDSGAATWIDFLNRVSIDSEKTEREMARRMKQLTLYHRLSVDYGLATDQLNAWGDPVVIAAHTATYLGNFEVAERVNRCVDTITHGDGFSTLEQLSHSGGAKVSSPAMPPLAPHYVERMEATRFVENAMFDQQGAIKPGSKIIVVTGIGGCGKTQLIRKFVEQHGHRFATVLFADGSSKETFQRDLVRHVRSLGTAHSQKPFDDSMVFLSQPVNGQRLLIIDNVDDPNLDLAPLLPRWSNGGVIVTSRSSSRGQLGHSHLELDVMSLDESVELLVRGSRRGWPPSDADKEAAIAVAKELGCHPIALVQAISYMSNTGHSAATYITRLQSYREPLLNDPAINQVEMRYKTAFAAFDASYEILSSNAQKALHLLSFFHWKNFCLDLVSMGAEDSFSTDVDDHPPRGEDFQSGKECLTTIFCPSGQWSLVELDSLITSLRSHSLVTVVSTEKVTLLQMHPLVHEWARLHLPRNDIAGFRRAAVRLLCCAARNDLHYMMQYIYAHVQALSHVWRDLHVNDTLAFAFIMKQSGRYNQAANLQESGYTQLKEQLGVDHPKTITASANLAFLYGELGRYSETEELEREVLQREIAHLGVDDPRTIAIFVNLASTYGELGRYEEAEVIQKEALQRSRTILGMDHPNTISASACLATTCRELGRYGEAEELEKEVLQRRRTILGMDHPHTIRACANLATTCRKLGRYSEAEVMEKEVLQRSRTILGMDHPDTISASACLATTYHQLGRYGEAEELGKEVIQRRKTVLGVDHPDTINASENLAGTYYTLMRYAEAEALEKDVLRQRNAILGNRHQDTLSAMVHLAEVYKAMRRLPEAIELARNATQMLLETQGEMNPMYIRSSTLLTRLTGGPPSNRGAGIES